MGSPKKNHHFTLELDSSKLSLGQQRLIRYLNSVLIDTVTSSDEAEYFDGANEAMRMFAGLIKESRFAQEKNKNKSAIPYSDQVLEFCMETMRDDLSQKKTIIFDN
ncbi:MAG: hypothetical protein OXB88_10485 [Bacteriovoracales bacterium]|nr:hypothetical protein [Bacteriovoracales bacterium]